MEAVCGRAVKGARNASFHGSFTIPRFPYCMHTLIWFARVGEAAVLAAAGFLKARHPTTARAAVGALGVPARLAAPIAIALPMVELVVAGLLLVGPLLW